MNIIYINYNLNKGILYHYFIITLISMQFNIFIKISQLFIQKHMYIFKLLIMLSGQNFILIYFKKNENIKNKMQSI